MDELYIILGGSKPELAKSLVLFSSHEIECLTIHKIVPVSDGEYVYATRRGKKPWWGKTSKIPTDILWWESFNIVSTVHKAGGGKSMQKIFNMHQDDLQSFSRKQHIDFAKNHGFTITGSSFNSWKKLLLKNGVVIPEISVEKVNENNHVSMKYYCSYNENCFSAHHDDEKYTIEGFWQIPRPATSDECEVSLLKKILYHTRNMFDMAVTVQVWGNIQARNVYSVQMQHLASNLKIQLVLDEKK